MLKYLSGHQCKETYYAKAYYATSADGDYTEVTGTGDGLNSFVERTHSLPNEAQVSTLYLKIVFKTSNTQGVIDEVNLAGEKKSATEAYTVTFNNDATKGVCETTSLKESGPNAGVILPACTSNDGYSFVGWATSADATTADAGKAGDTYYPTSATTLYAVYEEAVNVTWSVNGNTSTEKVVKGSNVNFVSPTDIPDGYSFIGWSASEVPTTNTQPTLISSATAESNVTYYAVFAQGTGASVTRITDTDGLEAGTYAVISYYGSYYLPNTSVTSGQPAAKATTKSGDDITITDDMKFNLAFVSGSTTSFTLESASKSGVYIWGWDKSTGVTVATSTTASGATNSWSLKDNGDYGLCLTAAGSRYLCTYGTKDWRSYTSTNATNLAANLYKISGSYYGYTTNTTAETYTEASLSLVAKSGDDYYATFSNENVTFFPESDDDISFTTTVKSAYSDGTELILPKLNTATATINGKEVSGYFVPANTGVLIQASFIKSETTVPYYTVTNKTVAPLSDNMLYPGSQKMTGDYLFYKLAYDNYSAKTGLGFYWGAENGAAFTSKAGLAYLAIPKSSSAKSGFAFDGSTTGVKAIEDKTKSNDITYNLAGMRVNANYKGIVIVNGKKVIRK